MAEKEKEEKEEIIIVKRGGGGDDGHHSAAWKIAYADFMTAMMAFFLVMWLVNSASDDTKVQVANYFNPIKLADSQTNPKGLKDVESGAHGEKNEVGSSETTEEQNKKGKQSSEADAEQKFTEEALFKDPYSVLEQIADSAAVAEKGEDSKPIGESQVAGYEGLASGEAFRDPFDPDYWQLIENAKIVNEPTAPTELSAELNDAANAEPDAPGQIQLQAEQLTGPQNATDSEVVADARVTPVEPVTPVETEEVQTALLEDVAQPQTPVSEAADSQPANPAQEEIAAADNPNIDTQPDADKAEASKGETKPAEAEATELAEAAPAEKPEMAQKNEKDEEPEVSETAKAKAQVLQDHIRQAIKKSSSGKTPNVEVEATAEGLLISLTDEFDFGMFDIASAQPKPGTILAMDTVAALLKERNGSIVIRGFTDARRFKTKAYDNWRLSTDRAHLAYYMLTRAGIERERVERIEGYADTKLRVPNDPFAARNRRIEILLRNDVT